MLRITPTLWFDHQAEEAARHYVSIFPNSKVGKVTRYSRASSEASGRPEGSVMTVAFALDGQPFVGLNGGPVFHFTEAISLAVRCQTQAEVDHYWARLSEGGEEGPCGWLKDRYGVSWQVVPAVLEEILADPDPARGEAATRALLGMKKLDVAALRRAADEA